MLLRESRVQEVHQEAEEFQERVYLDLRFVNTQTDFIKRMFPTEKVVKGAIFYDYAAACSHIINKGIKTSN